MKKITKISAKQKIGLVALGIFLSLALIEGAMRLAGFTILFIQEYQNKNSIRSKEAYVIMCLGESTTANDGLNGTHCYTRQLKDILNTENMGKRLSIINKGVSGTNTTRILSELESNIEQYKPDMVIAMMGINDEGEHIPREAENPSKITSFLQSLKIYKLSRFIWLHAVTKLNEGHVSNGPKSAALKDYISNDTPNSKECYAELVKNDNEKKSFSLENPDSLAIEDHASNNAPVSKNSKEHYSESAKYCNERGDFLGESNALVKAIKLDADNSDLYFRLQVSYRLQSRFKEAESVLKEIIDRFPAKADMAAAFLIACYNGEGRYAEMFALFNDPANKNNFLAHAEIWTYYITREDYEKAGEIAKKMSEMNNLALSEHGMFIKADGHFETIEKLLKERISRDPENAELYAFLALIYSEMNKPGVSKRYFSIAEGLRLKYYNSKTRENYRRLKEILDKKNIKLMCVQYPMRSVLPLKKIFEGGDKGIIFVDNEKVFKDAVMKAKYNDYFLDAFGGDFGHCTLAGNRLLAENIAKALKSYFKEIGWQ